MHKYTGRYNQDAEDRKRQIGHLIEKNTSLRVTGIRESPESVNELIDGSQLKRGAFGYIKVGEVTVIEDNYEPYLMELNEKKKYWWVDNVKHIRIVGYVYQDHKILKVARPDTRVIQYMIFDKDDRKIYQFLGKEQGAVETLQDFVSKGGK